MTLELFFKIVFVVLFLAFAGVMSFYRRRAKQIAGGWQDRLKAHNQHEVKSLLVLRTLFGLPFYLGLLVWLFAPQWLAWSALPLPEWARWLGVALAVVAVALNVWSHQTLSAKLGPAFNPVLRLTRVPALVTEGPYRWVRHPIYLAFFTMMLAALLLTANGLIGGSGLALIASVIVIRTGEEERLLIEQFGDEYRRYQAHTGGYLPRLSGS